MSIILFIVLLFNLAALLWYADQGHMSWGNAAGAMLMIAALTIGE